LMAGQQQLSEDSLVVLTLSEKFFVREELNVKPEKFDEKLSSLVPGTNKLKHGCPQEFFSRD